MNNRFISSFASLLLFFGLTQLSCGNAKDAAYRKEIAALRMELNEEFFDPSRTPLDSAYLYSFKGLRFFPVNEEYRVLAKVSLAENTQVFELPHSHERTKPYKFYGKLSFQLLGQNCALTILEPQIKKPGAENYLLLPFTDATNVTETYGGGRYLDLDKLSCKEGAEIVIDFNKAYNPYCAYSSKYTCPIPPKENNLDLRIEAGVKYEQ